MNYLKLATAVVFTTMTISAVWAQSASQARPGVNRAGTNAIPRTPDGHPDLQGVWTNASITPLERPAEFAGKATVTDAEAKAYEDKHNRSDSLDTPVNSKYNKWAGGPGTGSYNNLFTDQGSELARVDGVKRTSFIVDPPDGKIPPRVTAASRGSWYSGGDSDDIKNHPLAERCIIGQASSVGPPMMPSLYDNYYQIVQTPEYVMILVEQIHDPRIIRMNGTHPSKNIRQMIGDSIGHWEGDTLVVETTNFDPRTTYAGSSGNVKVTERFRRVDSGTILYQATIDDPTTFTKPWTLEMPFLASNTPIYEYACHEGNYAMVDILKGARELESKGKH
jgi:hypothetical protein